MTLNESQTRTQLINPQLRVADWPIDDRSRVGFEIPVDGYDAEPWKGVTDYCLKRSYEQLKAEKDKGASTRSTFFSRTSSFGLIPAR